MTRIVLFAGLALIASACGLGTVTRNKPAMNTSGSNVPLAVRAAAVAEYAWTRGCGTNTVRRSPIDIPTTTTECDLKITRRLNVFSIYWRENENAEWRSIEDVETVF